MDFANFFPLSHGNGADLPRPNAEMRMSGDDGEWTAEQIRGIICNPIYAGIGPFPPLVDDKAWVHAAAASMIGMARSSSSSICCHSCGRLLKAWKSCL